MLAVARPERYWGTHAGSATYPMSRTWQREYGVFRFMARAPHDPVLATSRYLRLLHDVEVVGGGPATYLGSPALAMRTLGDDATYLLCDLDPGSVSDLAAEARR